LTSKLDSALRRAEEAEEEARKGRREREEEEARWRRVVAEKEQVRFFCILTVFCAFDYFLAVFHRLYCIL
jgi:hypothetical protein